MNSFKPESFSDDIVVVDMKSLGRGRGFKVTAEYSALNDDELMGRIAGRLHKLLRLIEGDSLGRLEVENVRLDDQVEELDDEVKAVTSELEAALGRVRELEKECESLDELLSMVNEALEHAYDESFQDLGSAIEALISEYDDLMEEVEDEA